MKINIDFEKIEKEEAARKARREAFARARRIAQSNAEQAKKTGSMKWMKQLFRRSPSHYDSWSKHFSKIAFLLIGLPLMISFVTSQPQISNRVINIMGLIPEDDDDFYDRRRDILGHIIRDSRHNISKVNYAEKKDIEKQGMKKDINREEIEKNHPELKTKNQIIVDSIDDLIGTSEKKSKIRKLLEERRNSKQ